MIPIKNEVNYKIDWHGFKLGDDIQAQTKVLEDRKHYFDMLRRFLKELDQMVADYGLITEEELKGLFEKYNIHFVNIDDIPRVNIDEP